MRNLFTLIIALLSLAIGAVAGHYHGKAVTLEAMLLNTTQIMGGGNSHVPVYHP